MIGSIDTDDRIELKSLEQLRLSRFDTRRLAAATNYSLLQPRNDALLSILFKKETTNELTMG